MITVQNVYSNKAAVGNIDNVNGLIGIFQKADKKANISVHNRSIFIESEKQINFAESIEKWIKKQGIQLTCGIHHIYDKLPIAKNSCLIRI